ncbi:MAG: SUMF1/EgtB/PvdO family nonheme iron enzyme [Planctomycetota bacterium]|jgi:formylglycine-generating enzyme required for sulfatase activity
MLAPIVCACCLAFAPSDPQVHPIARDLAIDAEDPTRVSLTIAWPNAWRNGRNHDAAWIVLRGANGRAGLQRLASEGHAVLGKASVPAELTPTADGAGIFVAPAVEHRGDVEWHLQLRLREPAAPDLRAWTVGMVQIPEGPFELGDTHPIALEFGAFHRVGVDGQPAGTYAVAYEGAIQVDAGEPGALWYTTEEHLYRGDQQGPIPAEYPKGTRAFYVMKHEVTQGLYADFLSALPEAWREEHAPGDLEGVEEGETCSLQRTKGGYVALAPGRPCNFVTWEDSCALFDWLGLRPMSEFEFEKAARGPRRPRPLDFPWGGDRLDELERRVTPERDLTHATLAHERELSDEHRAALGASYYWVFDLSGSLWERCVSAGQPAGRAFRGSHGDGLLSDTGQATNADWPRSAGRVAEGLGYRGGAEYFGPIVPDNPTNPASPVALRTYAGWGGSYRYKTYGARGVRTSPAIDG